MRNLLLPPASNSSIHDSNLFIINAMKLNSSSSFTFSIPVMIASIDIKVTKIIQLKNEFFWETGKRSVGRPSILKKTVVIATVVTRKLSETIDFAVS